MSDSAQRTVIDRHDAAGLPDHDPNCAAGVGNYNHEDHAGGPVDEDPEVLAAMARLDADNSGGNQAEPGGQVS